MPANRFPALLSRTALVLVLIVSAAGCSDPIKTDGNSVQIERLEGFFPATYSGLTESENLVIRDFDGWSAFWDRHQPGNERIVPPVVDFDTQMVLVVALGSRSTGGYSVEIQAVQSQSDGSLDVQALERVPGDNCGVTQALTQPVDAVLVPRSGGDVRFAVTSQTYTCGP